MQAEYNYTVDEENAVCKPIGILGPHFCLQLLNKLSLSCLAILVLLKLPFITGMFLFEFSAQLDVLLNQTLIADFIDAHVASIPLQ